MKTRKDSIGEWLMGKILVYLKSKENFTIPFGIDERDMTKVVIQDTMGFRYEITVKNIDRNPSWVKDSYKMGLEII